MRSFPCFLSLWISASGSCDTATACIHVCSRSVGWKWRVVALGSSPSSRERQHTHRLLSTSISLYLQFLQQRTKRSSYALGRYNKPVKTIQIDEWK